MQNVPQQYYGKTLAAPRRSTLIDGAYRRLRDDVITGRLAPGVRLKVEHLRLDYRVGSSTLREALTRLCADGLAVSEGQRGFRVAPVSLPDLKDITTLRELLEARALREAIANGGGEWEEAIRTAFARLSEIEALLPESPAEHATEWEQRNRDFHRALVGACTSRRLLNFLEILYNQHERYRRLALVGRTVPRNVHAEHQAIFDATLARDADRACALIEEHILRTVEVLAAGIVNGTWFGSPGP